MFQASKPALAAISGLIAATAQAGEPLQLPRPDGSQTPLQVYRPAGECRAVAVLSHGAGGSEQALAYLAEALQQAGWLALVPGHRESGRQVLRGEIRREGLRDGLLALTTDAAAYRARLEEIGTALHWGRGQCAGRFAVLLGHSMGAATVMLEAGAANRLGVRRQLLRCLCRVVAAGAGQHFPAAGVARHSAADVAADRHTRPGSGRRVDHPVAAIRRPAARLPLARGDSRCIAREPRRRWFFRRDAAGGDRQCVALSRCLALRPLRRIAGIAGYQPA